MTAMSGSSPIPAAPNAIESGRLASAMNRARHAPFYQTPAWQTAFDLPSPTLRDFPKITKSQLREHSPEGFLPPGPSLASLLERGEVEEESTSGTSGASVRVIFGKTWWAEQEERALRQSPLLTRILDAGRAARRAVFTTPGCSGVSCYNRWLSLEQRTLESTLYINQTRIPFTLGDDKLAAMAQEAIDWQPTFLDVDPVHGAWFALYCERHGLRLPSLRFILTSYEYTSVVHRRILERVFGVPLLNLYGSSETGHLIIDDDGHPRTSVETALLELTEPNATGVGELLVTTLTNPYLPLLRYEIGDYAEAASDSFVVHGRKRDALRGPQGNVITTRQVDQCFTDIEGIAHYQLRQQADGSGSLFLLPESAGDGLSAGQVTLRHRLSNLLGAEITTTVSPLITPEDSGKFRLTLRIDE